MDFIGLKVGTDEPLLAYVHACRTTDLNTKTRQELADASNYENYAEGLAAAAATRRRKSKKKFKPGGKSRFTRKVAPINDDE